MTIDPTAAHEALVRSAARELAQQAGVRPDGVPAGQPDRVDRFLRLVALDDVPVAATGGIDRDVVRQRVAQAAQSNPEFTGAGHAGPRRPVPGSGQGARPGPIGDVRTETRRNLEAMCAATGRPVPPLDAA